MTECLFLSTTKKILFMKRLLVLCTLITLLACKTETPKDYVTLSGKIENSLDDKTLKIFRGRQFEKTITLNEDGTFKDTLKVETGTYNFKHGQQFGEIYLSNNNTSTLNTDYTNFDDTLVFGGDAANTNNLSIKAYLISNNHFTNAIVSSGTKEDLDTAIKNYRAEYESLKVKYTGVDSTNLARIDNNITKTINQMKRFMSSKIAMRASFPKGSPSPTFTNYENHAGGTVSLSDLKGTYVYIDVWASWCGPCIAEIPSLKKVEKQFHGKNITFVSISIDEGRGYKGDAAEAYKGWKKMVTEKELGGLQLIADNGFRSQFTKAYKVNGIPRFLLIDPNGNIVNADAPRPSNPQLVELLKSLGI